MSLQAPGNGLSRAGACGGTESGMGVGAPKRGTGVVARQAPPPSEAGHSPPRPAHPWPGQRPCSRTCNLLWANGDPVPRSPDRHSFKAPQPQIHKSPWSGEQPQHRRPWAQAPHSLPPAGSPERALEGEGAGKGGGGGTGQMFLEWDTG